MSRDQLGNELVTSGEFYKKKRQSLVSRSHERQADSLRLTLFGKVEQFWHGLAVGQSSTLNPQFVKELVSQSRHGTAIRPVSISDSAI
jgi:hypothetical protein